MTIHSTPTSSTDLQAMGMGTPPIDPLLSGDDAVADLDASIVIPAYNAERYIGEALSSALRQTYPADRYEVIVVDDGSTDSTLSIANSVAMSDPRLTVISRPNAGSAVSRNAGIRAARGRWILTLDADDRLYPEALAQQLAFARHHEASGVIAAGCLPNYVDADGRSLGRQYSELLRPEDFFRLRAEHREISIPHPGSLLNRAAVLAIGGYRQAFWPVEDLDLFNRLADLGGIVLVNRAYLFDYRIHDKSASVALARQASLKRRWVLACIEARRRRVPEPDLDQFKTIETSTPKLTRFNQLRTDIGLAWYKAAAAAYSGRRRLATAGKLTMALLLVPHYTMAQIWNRWIKPRTSGS